MSYLKNALRNAEQSFAADFSRASSLTVFDAVNHQHIPSFGELIGFAAGDAPVPSLQLTESSSAPGKIDRPGDYHETIMVGGVPRTYILHVPPGYDPGKPMPLVVALHGLGGSGAEFERRSGIDAEADQKGFIVAYPDATEWLGKRQLAAWDTGNGLVPAGGKADDVGFLRSLIDTTQKQMSVDPRRIYMVGVSNGGMEAYRAAAELSDKVAAVVDISGGMSGREPAPCQPVSVLSIVGTSDRIVPPGGSSAAQEAASVGERILQHLAQAVPAGGREAAAIAVPALDSVLPGLASRLHFAPAFKPVSYATSFWKTADGITGPPVETKDGAVTTDVYTNPTTGVTVEQEVVQGADHVLQHGAPPNFSLADQAWSFLSAHEKPAGTTG